MNEELSNVSEKAQEINNKIATIQNLFLENGIVVEDANKFLKEFDFSNVNETISKIVTLKNQSNNNDVSEVKNDILNICNSRLKEITSIVNGNIAVNQADPAKLEKYNNLVKSMDSEFSIISRIEKNIEIQREFFEDYQSKYFEIQKELFDIKNGNTSYTNAEKTQKIIELSVKKEEYRKLSYNTNKKIEDLNNKKITNLKEMLDMGIMTNKYLTSFNDLKLATDELPLTQEEKEKISESTRALSFEISKVYGDSVAVKSKLEMTCQKYGLSVNELENKQEIVNNEQVVKETPINTATVEPIVEPAVEVAPVSSKPVEPEINFTMSPSPTTTTFNQPTVDNAMPNVSPAFQQPALEAAQELKQLYASPEDLRTLDDSNKKNKTTDWEPPKSKFQIMKENMKNMLCGGKQKVTNVSKGLTDDKIKAALIGAGVFAFVSTLNLPLTLIGGTIGLGINHIRKKIAEEYAENANKLNTETFKDAEKVKKKPQAVPNDKMINAIVEFMKAKKMALSKQEYINEHGMNTQFNEEEKGRSL